MFDDQSKYPTGGNIRYLQCMLMYDDMKTETAWMPKNLAVTGKKYHLSSSGKSFKILSVFEQQERTGNDIHEMRNQKFLTFKNR